MIRCPHCKSGRSNVIGGQWDPRPEDHDYNRRRRRCVACSKVFHTREYNEGNPVSPQAMHIALGLLTRVEQYLTGERKVGKRRQKK